MPNEAAKEITESKPNAKGKLQEETDWNNLRIYTYGDPLLRENAREIETFDSSLIHLADNMYQIMRKSGGIGLAGPQVGILKRIIVVDTQEKDGIGRLNLVNPKVIYESEETEVREEGCLSIPEVYAKVVRPQAIRVEARTITGETLTFNAKGLLARVILHEIDHLDGKLFIDRVSQNSLKDISEDLERLRKKHQP